MKIHEFEEGQFCPDGTFPSGDYGVQCEEHQEWFFTSILKEAQEAKNWRTLWCSKRKEQLEQKGPDIKKLQELQEIAQTIKIVTGENPFIKPGVFITGPSEEIYKIYKEVFEK